MREEKDHPGNSLDFVIDLLEQEPLDIPAAPNRETAEGSVWRALELHGASTLYGLSAVCILYGLSLIIGPVLARSDALWDKLSAIGALNLYELSLLAVLLLIVRLRANTRDAISLVVLIGVFLGASGIALSSLATDAPNLSLVLGAISLALAAAKWSALRLGAQMDLGILAAISSGLLLLWLFASPPVLAMRAEAVLPARHSLLALWLWGMLAAFASVVSGVGYGATRRTGSLQSPAPFLHRPAMAWMFVAVLAVGLLLQQRAIAYIYELPDTPLHYAPIAMVALLALSEHMRAHGYVDRAHHAALAAAPAVLLVISLLMTMNAVRPPTLPFLFQPATLFFLLALWLLARGFTLGWSDWRQISVGYFLLGILFFGVGPGLEMRLYDPTQWQPAGAFGLLLSTILAFRLRSIVWGYVTLFLLCGVFMLDLPAWMHMNTFGMRLLAAFCYFNLGGLLLCAIFPTKGTVELAQTHALLLCLSFAGVFQSSHNMAYPWVLALLMAACAPLLLFRMRDFVAPAALLLPLLWQSGQHITPITPWHFVAVGFILLGIGAAASLRIRASAPGVDTPLSDEAEEKRV
jgi:hypothetical protein